MNKIVIATDGPSSSGKGTVSKKVAELLSINYIDSGAMYRAVTVYLIENNINIENEDEVSKNLENIHIDIDDKKVILNGEEVTGKIREENISENVYKVARQKDVRFLLEKMQKEMARNKSIVMDGRDIGSNVLKEEANFKFYIDADVEERARRRYKQLDHTKVTFEQVRKEIEDRDYSDTHRDLHPLVKADDAILIDTTNMTIDEVVDFIVRRVKK